MKRTILLLFTGISLASGSYGQESIDFGDYFQPLHMVNVTKVKSQDITGTCWSYSTTSYLESELIRLGRGEWDLSEMFVVRMIYLDKADQYIRFQGKANFSQGSLGHDLLRVYRNYGMMPESAYSGYNGKSRHDHTGMEASMKKYLDSMINSGKINPVWKDDLNAIMDEVMGKIPVSFDVNGTEHTARSFADEVLKLNVDDYVGFTSFIHQPENECVVVQVPDNYSRGQYCNLSLDKMLDLMKFAVEHGHSIEWDGDVSGGGFNPKAGLAIYISDTVRFTSLQTKPSDDAYSANKRQEEFDAYITTDDHLMHITGLAKGKDSKTYFITKNSWGDKLSFSGYLMMSEHYAAMKTVCIIVHKDAIPEALKETVVNGCNCL